MKLNVLNITQYPERIFLVIALIFGLIMIVITPPFRVADEPAHFFRAMEVENGVWCNHVSSPHAVGKSSAKFLKQIKNAQIFYGIDKYELLNYEVPIPKERSLTIHTSSGYPPLMYMCSAAGIKVVKFFNGNLLTAFYVARLFNLFLWIVMIAWAIKITPIFKYPFLFCALLPMSVFQGMSISGDSYANAFTFLFIAFMFKLIYQNKKIKALDLSVFSLLSLLSPFAKGFFYPTFLFLLISKNKFKNGNKGKFLIFIPVILLAVSILVLWSVFNSAYVPQPVGTNPEAHKMFLMSHPFEYVKMFFVSILKPKYLQEGIGVLGWLDIKLPMNLYRCIAFVFLSMFLFIKESGIKFTHRLLAFSIITVFVFLLETLLFITWTPLNYSQIEGFQGRYLIQVLPFLFMILAQGKFELQGNASKIYKLGLIIAVLVSLTISCRSIFIHYTLF